ncbi:MAG TPA: DUF6249 domain-containing protein [Vicinamibacteria bacterium]|nr:DUF6249 domain-containing protein [Vicinamibacteria bacterium]
MGSLSTWPPLLAMMILAIPIVAIMGGILAGILKTRGQQRLLELAQRERIAAIEKGIDPSRLPPLPVIGDDLAPAYLTPRQADLRRAQGLLIGGLVLLAIGLGLSTMLVLLPDPDARRAWAAGLIPSFIGLALIASSAIVRREAPAETDGVPGSRG